MTAKFKILLLLTIPILLASRPIIRNGYQFSIPDNWIEFSSKALETKLYEIGISDTYDGGFYYKMPIYNDSYPMPCVIFKHNPQSNIFDGDYNSNINKLQVEYSFTDFEIVEYTDQIENLLSNNKNYHCCPVKP